MNAVLVLDSSVAASVFGAVCAEEGFAATVLPSDTADLVERIACVGPALVVVRRHLNHIDGAQLCRALRAHPELGRVRVLLVSSRPEGDTEARSCGAHGFLRLPYRPEEARTAIRACLDAPPRLLVVEDSRAQRGVVVAALRAEGWEVLEADDGKEALEVLHANGSVDLVISDIEMPRMDGLALCAALHADPSTVRIPVILLTSLDSQEAIARGFAAGAADYLTKPVMLSELVARVPRLLASRVSPRSERVLVIDPDPSRARNLAEVLSTHGLVVSVVAEGDRARAQLETRPPQLVVADAALGGDDGIAFARAMRRDERLAEIPFVLVADRASRAQDVRAASAGIQTVVVRPYAPDRLLAEVERVLGEARVRRQHTVLRRYLSGEALSAMTRFVEGDSAPGARAALQHRTVLFADLAGFTTLCETRAPGDVVSILNAFFDAAVPVLVRHGASIDKFIGDCILAVFDGEARGALGAARAALEIVQDVLPALRAELGLELHLRVGLNAGAVLVGDIGSRHFRRDFTVIGDVVNVAQRLQSLAEVDEVLVGASVHALLESAVEYGPPRPLRLKGRASEEQAWPVLRSVQGLHE
jgi:DNA-binding response OmpR family regulator